MTENSTYFITAYYKFISIENVEITKLFFENTAKKNNILGLIILAPEGFNSTVSAKNKLDLENYKSEILKHFNLNTLNFKDSTSSKPPFRRLSIKLRSEIVTLGTPELRPPDGKNYHLSPTEWNHVMKNERENIALIDTRNWYETKIGTFTNAVNPKTDYFTEFPKFMESQNISTQPQMAKPASALYGQDEVPNDARNFLNRFLFSNQLQRTLRKSIDEYRSVYNQ